MCHQFVLFCKMFRLWFIIMQSHARRFSHFSKTMAVWAREIGVLNVVHWGKTVTFYSWYLSPASFCASFITLMRWNTLIRDCTQAVYKLPYWITYSIRLGSRCCSVAGNLPSQPKLNYLTTDKFQYLS